MSNQKNQVSEAFQKNPGVNDRLYWVGLLDQIAKPVLKALSERRLKRDMPAAGHSDRSAFAHLEALGRLLCGIAPWLEAEGLSEEEEELRQQYANWARDAITAGTDPNSPDYMNFEYEHQPIVDAAFLAQAVLRAPKELFEKLDEEAKGNLIDALQATRTRLPAYNNWLLFAATIEAALHRMGADWDVMRVDYALLQHEQWYVGDGAYGDGPSFHWDYYNSFVIQPMLVDVLAEVGHLQGRWSKLIPTARERACRYAAVLERFIAPDGTYPPIGRSLVYRFGAFHALSQAALLHRLPDEVSPAQVRCALTAVMRRTMRLGNNFDEGGWLTIGLSGHQPGLGEPYISTGSLYLCAAVFLPLGLSPNDDFWQGEAKWTAVKAWTGEATPIDHAY
ncbi:DUF2264 domain-containing protein [Paenibacillus sp. HB172176]|uniref:DUF2264 domain-containing protein n=1 Tax=Paenibacillus sp. HB172176 TaxID=2493690 RepID=UPI00143ADE0F|nr:DUF2264 domain-containing protein [Paenibacillus sp. HB172176]